MSSVFYKFKKDNFWAPFLKVSEVTTKNGGGEGSISLLIGSPYVPKSLEQVLGQIKIGPHLQALQKERGFLTAFDPNYTV